jgi:hypothetical protein
MTCSHAKEPYTQYKTSGGISGILLLEMGVMRRKRELVGTYLIIIVINSVG